MTAATTWEIVATACFGAGVIHTFLAKKLHPKLDLEWVFGIWATLFLLFSVLHQGVAPTASYVNGLSFAEPIFVFVVMAVAATRPILDSSAWVVDRVASWLPIEKKISFFVVALVLGPLLGSVITEPAAMTVTALLLLNTYFKQVSERLKYFTIALLFVNVSIGGTLTPFAAPPVLMVASTWKWDFEFMLTHFGWKSALACVISASLTAFVFRRELLHVKMEKQLDRIEYPLGLTLLHWLALAGVVVFHTSIPLFVGILILFYAFHHFFIRKEKIDFHHSILVAVFLSGLVILGKPQRWWLEPLLGMLEPGQLYLGAIALTAVTDNAALTYLGAQVPDLSEVARYALVAGAVVGGGLTVIANAPNPVGFGILQSTFGEKGINPLYLLLAALPSTLIAGVCLWFL